MSLLDTAAWHGMAFSNGWSKPEGGEAGEALVADPNVRVISFTGSTAAGRRVGNSRPATSSARTWNSAATRRSSCWTTRT